MLAGLSTRRHTQARSSGAQSRVRHPPGLRAQLVRSEESVTLNREASLTLPPGRQRLVGLLFLVSGAGLVAHILVGLPLWVTVPGGLTLVATFLLWVGAFTGVDLRPIMRSGLLVGAVATAAYDLSRVAVVALLDLPVRPFAAWPLFGAALIGEGAPVAARIASGFSFHLMNGVAFAVAYTAWFASRGVRAGIMWGLFLEAFMLGLYPGWLNIADYGPFLAVSLVGHVVYGAVLGTGAQAMATRSGAA
jgi:hypothetical protein